MAERRKCYTILGLDYGATKDDIKKAYKKLALQFHPDKNSSEDAKGRFQEIGYAYKYLTEGPSTLQTSDPHDLREEFLRRLFEDLFFPRFHHQQQYFGGFPFFFADDDDDDDDDCYFYSSDSSDEYGYTRNHFHRFNVPTGSGAGTTAGQPASSYHQPSAKQQQKKEKRKRHRERAKENRRRQKEEDKKNAEQASYTNDINTEPNSSTKPKETEEQVTCDKNDDNNNAVPSKAAPTSKMNKKERKKLESEQRKRDKEMKEIAAELMRKQEQDLERQREKEKLAARKKEEEKTDKSDVPHFYAQKEKKSRKARQREKKRQEASCNITLTPGCTGYGGRPESQPAPKPRPADNSSGTPEAWSSLKHRQSDASSSSGFSSTSAMKDKRERVQRKSGNTGSRFDILDDLDDILEDLEYSEDSRSETPEPLSDNSSTIEGNSSSKQSHHSSKTSDHNCITHSNSRKNDFGKEKISNMHNNGVLFNKSVNQTVGCKRGSGNHGNTGSNYSAKFGSSYSESKHERKTSGVVGRDNGLGKGSSNDKQNVHVDSEDDDDGSTDDDDVQGNISNGFNRSKHSSNNQNPSHRNHGYRPNNNPHVNGYFGDGNMRGRSDAGYRESIPRTRGYPRQQFNGPNYYPGYRGPPQFSQRFNGPDYYQGFRGPPPMQGPYPPRSYPPRSYPPRSSYFNGYNGMPPQQGNNFRGGYPEHPQFGYHPNSSPHSRNHPNSSTRYSDNATKQRSGSPQQKLHKGHIVVADEKQKKVEKSDLPSKAGTNPSKPHKTQNTENVETATNFKDVNTGKHQKPVSSSFKNMFSTKVYNNQACSRETLDLLDDIEDIPNSFEENQPAKVDLLSGLASSVSDIDTGIDAFLSRDKLGVPKGFNNDNIKNYYK